jgi:acetyl coenzyme A synthetase (ADP forming)-like protein
MIQKELYLPPLYQDSADGGRLILRDGSTATIRMIRPQDQKALTEFFDRLSPESRWLRFFSFAKPGEVLLHNLCNPPDFKAQLTLVVTRVVGEVTHIIAVGTYWAQNDKTAEVAFSVEDTFQGKGIGTLLLERLALLAVRNGYTEFWATTHFTNQPMLEVFHRSGFPIQTQAQDGYVELRFSVLPTHESVERSEIVDRLFTTASLLPIFRPKSIAVIGASRDPKTIGYRIVEELVRNHFQGPVYPVNPKASSIASIHSYHSVSDLPERVDLGIVTVPVSAVMNVVDECAAKGVRALIVITAGFAEVDENGRQIQRQLLEKVRGSGMRMVGPNCMGVLNTDPEVSMNASFSPIFPPVSSVAMSSQSGALGIAILDVASRRGLGVSTFISVGNKADVSGNDLLQYWEEDPHTNVILLYLESFGNPRRFARLARRVSRTKPIVAVKSGRTVAGKRAAGSHTAALAASDVAVEALFSQTGVIRAQTLEEMFDLAALLASQPLPKGRRVGIVTNAGGPGILCTDACEANGLVVPEFSEQTKKRLSEFLPPAASLNNPVDMIASASPDHYRNAINVILDAEEVDALVVLYIPVMNTEWIPTGQAIAKGIESARKKGGKGKPVVTCLLTEEQRNQTLIINDEKIPAYRFPEEAAQVLGKAATYAEWLKEPPGIIPNFDDIDPKSARNICNRAIQERGPGWLTAQESRDVLNAMRLPIPEGGVAANSEEAISIAEKIGFPVALKLASHELIHKTEAGGVFLNLKDAEDVKKAFLDLRKKLQRKNQLSAMEGVLVQPMIHSGIEAMVGVTEDPLFGSLIAFGLGGIHVEILGDVCFRVNPLTDKDAAKMVRQIRGYRLFEGYRGHPPGDTKAVENVLLRISRLVEEVSEVRELDLNPIFVFQPGKGCLIADVRIKVRSSVDGRPH